MNARKMVLSLLALMSAALLVGFNTPEFIEDSVRFDQAFIPPLALTNQEKLQPSLKAMERLNAEWNRFNNKYAQTDSDDPEWTNNFNEIESLIDKASKIVSSGTHLMAAHETLESVRIILMELRQRNQIAYYPDLLTRFHPHMEAIFHMAADNSPASLDEMKMDDMNRTLGEALDVWNQIIAAPFEPAVYDFNDAKARNMRRLIGLQTEALRHLQSALEAKDAATVIAAAKGIKPSYAQLYKLFGDFEGLMKRG